MYTFITENPTMVDAYWNIFNSMAALFSNTVYLNLLKLAFTLGGFFVFFNGIINSFKGSDYAAAPKDFFKYMIVGTALLTIIFSHKSELLVKTEHITSYCPTEATTGKSLISSNPVTTGTVIGNIPTVLAWGFNFLNDIGLSTTALAKEAFSATITTSTTTRSDYVSFLNGVNDIMNVSLNSLGSNLSFGGQKASLGEVFTLIMNDCVYIPASSDNIVGEKALNAVKSTGNTLETVHDLIVNGVISIYKNPTNTTPTIIDTAIKFNGTEPKNLLTNFFGNTYTCENAWTEFRTKYNELRNSQAVECNGDLKDTLSPITLIALTGDQNATLAMGKDIVMNAGLANQLLNSQRNLAIGEIDYASGKSMSEMAYKSVGTGYNIAEMIPYLQMGMRAVLYAFFPFVFVVILMPGGSRVLVSYLQTLLWIELWSPIAAILNMFLSYSSTKKFQSMYQSEGLNVLNGVQTFSDAYMLAGVAGYLYAMIPAIAWLILKQSGELMAGIGSKLASIMENNMSSKTINEDISSRAMNKSINSDRIEKGLKTISMAEQDYMASNHNSQIMAGKFSANEERKDELFKSSYGLTTKHISDGKIESNIRTAFGDKNTDNIRQNQEILDMSQNQQTQKKLGLNNLSGINDFGQVMAMNSVREFSKNKQFLHSENRTFSENVSNAEKMGNTEGAKNLLMNIAKQNELEMNGVTKKGEIDKNRLLEVAGVNALQSHTDLQTASKSQELTPNYVETVSDIKGNKSAMDNYANASNQNLQDTQKSFEIGASIGINKAIGINSNKLFLDYTKNGDTVSSIMSVASINSQEKKQEVLNAEAIQKNISESDRIKSNLFSEFKSVGEGLNIGNRQNIALQAAGINATNQSIADKARILNSIGIMSKTFEGLKGDIMANEYGLVGIDTKLLADNEISKQSSEIHSLIKKRELFTNSKLTGERIQNIANSTFSKTKDFSGAEKSVVFAHEITKELKSVSEPFETTKDSVAAESLVKNMSFGEAGALQGSATAQQLFQASYYKGHEEAWAKLNFSEDVVRKFGALGSLMENIMVNALAINDGLSKERDNIYKKKDKAETRIKQLKAKGQLSKDQKFELHRLEGNVNKFNKALDKNYKQSQKTMVGRMKMATSLMNNKVGTKILKSINAAEVKIKKSIQKKAAKAAAKFGFDKVTRGVAGKVLNKLDKASEIGNNAMNAAYAIESIKSLPAEYEALKDKREGASKMEVVAELSSNKVLELTTFGMVSGETVHGIMEPINAGRIVFNETGSIKEAGRAFLDNATQDMREVYLKSENINSFKEAEKIDERMRISLERIRDNVIDNKTGVIGEIGGNSGKIIQVERINENKYQYVFEQEGKTIKIDSQLNDKSFSSNGDISKIVNSQDPYSLVVMAIEINNATKSVEQALNSERDYREFKNNIESFDISLKEIANNDRGLFYTAVKSLF